MKSTALSLALALGALSWSPAARAETCMNDIDCKEAGTGCGSYVCQWVVDGATPHYCVPASTDPGWCSVATDCKCPGAMCGGATGTQCTFTSPQDAGGSASSSGAGGGGGGGGGCIIGYAERPDWSLALFGGLAIAVGVRRRRCT